jgi:UDP-N-acetylmuramyl pentapeptide phosphotransferase/UDP-N-acetylglucosamine-1-phosphate transferase
LSGGLELVVVVFRWLRFDSGTNGDLRPLSNRRGESGNVLFGDVGARRFSFDLGAQVVFFEEGSVILVLLVFFFTVRLLFELVQRLFERFLLRLFKRLLRREALSLTHLKLLLRNNLLSRRAVWRAQQRRGVCRIL